MAKKKGRGRPKLPKGTSKATVVTMRLQAAERKVLTAAAKKDNMTLSGWIRAVLLQRADPRYTQVLNAEGVPVTGTPSDP